MYPNMMFFIECFFILYIKMGVIDTIRWVFLIIEVSFVSLALYTMFVIYFRRCSGFECSLGVFIMLLVFEYIYFPICFAHFTIMLIRLLAYARPFTAIDAIHITYIVIVVIWIAKNKYQRYQDKIKYKKLK